MVHKSACFRAALPRGARRVFANRRRDQASAKRRVIVLPHAETDRIRQTQFQETPILLPNSTCFLIFSLPTQLTSYADFRQDCARSATCPCRPDRRIYTKASVFRHLPKATVPLVPRRLAGVALEHVHGQRVEELVRDEDRELGNRTTVVHHHYRTPSGRSSTLLYQYTCTPAFVVPARTHSWPSLAVVVFDVTRPAQSYRNQFEHHTRLPYHRVAALARR